MTLPDQRAGTSIRACILRLLRPGFVLLAPALPVLVLVGLALVLLPGNRAVAKDRLILPDPEFVRENLRDPASVQQAVQEVLADPEYRHLSRGEREDIKPNELPQWVRDFLKWLFGEGEQRESLSAPTWNIGDMLFYAAITVLVVVLIVLLVSLFNSRAARQRVEVPEFMQDEDAINPSTPPGDVPSNEYERRARAAAEAGDFRTGLRELVLGSMSWTERAGLIRYRSGLTNRDYVRAVWRQVERRESLLSIVACFERVFYGRRDADQETFDVCLGQFQQSFLQASLEQEGDDAQLPS